MLENTRICSPHIRYVYKRGKRVAVKAYKISTNLQRTVPHISRRSKQQLCDDREIGDRNELVLFSSPGDQLELDVVFERVYSEASKLFTSNRTKDQAVILAAFLRKLCYYPV